jgi:hypothetical protein
LAVKVAIGVPIHNQKHANNEFLVKIRSLGKIFCESRKA